MFSVDDILDHSNLADPYVPESLMGSNQFYMLMKKVCFSAHITPYSAANIFS